MRSFHRKREPHVRQMRARYARRWRDAGGYWAPALGVHPRSRHTQVRSPIHLRRVRPPSQHPRRVRQPRCPPLRPAASESALAAGVSGAAGETITGIDPLTGLPPTSAAAATRPALGREDRQRRRRVAAGRSQPGRHRVRHSGRGVASPGCSRSSIRKTSGCSPDQVSTSCRCRPVAPARSCVLRVLRRHLLRPSVRSTIIRMRRRCGGTSRPSLFVIRHDHAIPHQVFGTTAMLYAGGEQRSPSTTPPPPMFSYAATPPAGAAAATSITAQYSAATASWTWNGKQYLRIQSGHPDLLIDGSQGRVDERGRDVSRRAEHCSP